MPGSRTRVSSGSRIKHTEYSIKAEVLRYGSPPLNSYRQFKIIVFEKNQKAQPIQNRLFQIEIHTDTLSLPQGET